LIGGAHARGRKPPCATSHGAGSSRFSAVCTALVLKEAYRLVNVKAGDKTIKLPAPRSFCAPNTLAGKGNGPAQPAITDGV
jgi:hypothetical protein